MEEARYVSHLFNLYFEFIYTISHHLNGHAISISEMIKKMPIFDNVFQIAYCMIFIVGILYFCFFFIK
ncbi:MAG: hypothetical protein ACLR43_04085 [Faecalibacillus faecis]